MFAYHHFVKNYTEAVDIHRGLVSWFLDKHFRCSVYLNVWGGGRGRRETDQESKIRFDLYIHAVSLGVVMPPTSKRQ